MRDLKKVFGVEKIEKPGKKAKKGSDDIYANSKNNQ